MQIELIFLGKTRQDYLAAGIDDFCRRLKRYAKIGIKVVKDVKPASKPDLQIKQEEAAILLAHLAPRTFLIALDPAGRQLGSEKLAGYLEKLQEAGRNHLTIVIGGALGLAAEVLDRADLVLSLSKMTFTHEMARLLIVEQLYRAFNIGSGTGYHK